MLGVFFANIPYDLHLAQEKYYQTIFYLVFRLLGVYTEAEVKANDGRIDVVIALKTDYVGGANFDSAKRTVTAWKSETDKPVSQ